MEVSMSDLVERLRAQGKDAFAKHYSLGMFKLCDEAADHIETLEAALREIAQKRKMDAVAATSMQAIARAAIAPGEQNK